MGEGTKGYTQCMIPFMRSLQNRQIHRDRKGGWLSGEGDEVTVDEDRFLLG